MASQYLHNRGCGLEALETGRLPAKVEGDPRNPIAVEAPHRVGTEPVVLVEDRGREALDFIAREVERCGGEALPAGQMLQAVLFRGLPWYPGARDGEPERVVPYEEELEWARESVGWLKRGLPPGAFLAHAVLYRDEASPYVNRPGFSGECFV